ncbi:MAG: hypothetical protein SCALA701_00490 [Candidatus Scalindua sp.]|nr:MAG: hypothetical protein SCALA701_00490 [Candidatus Scalindua sp.]
MRKRLYIIFIFLSLSFVLPTYYLSGQPVDTTFSSSKQKIHHENIIKIIEGSDQDIAHFESRLSTLEEELKKLSLTEKKLIEEKAEIATIVLVAKQKDVLDENRDILNDIIRVRMEITEVADNIKEIIEETTTLSKRKNRINEEASLLTGSQFESFQKEVELLDASLESVLAKISEKEEQYESTQTTNDVLRLDHEEKKVNLLDRIAEFVSSRPVTEEEGNLIDKQKRILNNELKLRIDKIKLLSLQTELARLELQSAQEEIVNLELQKYINTEIVGILSQKFEAEEEERAEKEVEESERIENEIRKKAEEEKAKAELERREALRREVIAIQKSLKETSPEKKRLLEIEADIHGQTGLNATLKDELITVGTERYEYITDFKEIQTKVDEVLGGENTPGEIAKELNIIASEIKRLEYKIVTFKRRVSATEKQKAIIDESLEEERAELVPIVSTEKSNIEKEAEGFPNREEGEKLVELANIRFKLLEEQAKLIADKLDGRKEIFKSSEELLENLKDAQERLSEIQAANVWARRQNMISTNTIIEGVADIKALKDRPFDFYKESAQNLQRLSIYLEDSKNILPFIIKVVIIVFVIVFAFFARRMLYYWAGREIQKVIAVTPKTFFTFTLVPGLFRIMQETLTMLFLFVISLTISLVIPSHAPLLVSIMYGFAILSVYKFLNGILNEALSTDRDVKRWIPIGYSSARHISIGLNVILLFSAILITSIFVLNAYGYKRDVIELLWFLYRIVTIFLAVWIATSQRSVLLKMMPYYESAIGKFVNRVINILYPLLIAFVIVLFTIRSLGYVLLTYTFLITLVKSVIVSIIALIIYRFLLRRLSSSQERKLNRRRALGDDESLSEERLIKLRFVVCKSLLDYGFLIISVIIIFGMWNKTFKYVVSSPAAPPLFRSVYENVSYVFFSIKSSLTYKFTFAEGRYTTPFKMLIGILVLGAAFTGTKYLKNVLEKKVYEKAQLEQGARRAITSGTTFFIIGMAAIIGLNIAGIPLRSLTIFAGAFGIGLGFGMQNIINNLVSGIIIFFEKPIKIGDVITLDKR